MMSVRDYNALSVVANVEQGAMVKRLTEFVQFVAKRHERLRELHEALEYEEDNPMGTPPGYQAFWEVLDKLEDDWPSIVKENSNFWIYNSEGENQWESSPTRAKEYPEGYRFLNGE
jgi:hypothetical protein